MDASTASQTAASRWGAGPVIRLQRLFPSAPFPTTLLLPRGVHATPGRVIWGLVLELRRAGTVGGHLDRSQPTFLARSVPSLPTAQNGASLLSLVPFFLLFNWDLVAPVLLLSFFF